LDEGKRTYRVLIDLVFVLLAGDGGGHERALRVHMGEERLVRARHRSERAPSYRVTRENRKALGGRSGNARPRIGRAWRRTLDAEAAPAPAICCLAAGTNRDQSALAEVRSMVARARVASDCGKRAHKASDFYLPSR